LQKTNLDLQQQFYGISRLKFNQNYDFLVPLCLYLVQKYEKKNAVANDKWFLQLEPTI
jgi:hypothetical protein